MAKGEGSTSARPTRASACGSTTASRSLPATRGTAPRRRMSSSLITERLIGDAAKNQVAMNPINTVFGKPRSALLFP
jgi:molecular chaperone DnaK (HSP70)